MGEDKSWSYDNAISKHYIYCGFQWQKCIFIEWNVEVVEQKEETKNEFGSGKFSSLFAGGPLLALFFALLSWSYEDPDLLLFVWSCGSAIPEGLGILLWHLWTWPKDGRVTLGGFNGPGLELGCIITFIAYWPNSVTDCHTYMEGKLRKK